MHLLSIQIKMDDVYKNIDDYNPSRKISIVFDDMIADIMTKN